MPASDPPSVDFERLDRRHSDVLDRLAELEQQLEQALDEFGVQRESE